MMFAKSAATAAAFNPVTAISWSRCYYLEGPEAVALGWVDFGSIGSWPDEISTGDLAVSGFNPTYKSASTNMNNQPAITGGRMDTGTLTSIGPPVSIVVICYVGSVAAASYIHEGPNAGSSGSRIIIQAPPFSSSAWGLHAGSQATGGTASVGRHGVRAFVTSGTDSLHIDGSAVISGATAGNNAWAGVTTGGPAGAPFSFGEYSFIGIYSGDVTAHAQWSAFQSWATTKYSLSGI